MHLIISSWNYALYKFANFQLTIYKLTENVLLILLLSDLLQWLDNRARVTKWPAVFYGVLSFSGNLWRNKTNVFSWVAVGSCEYIKHLIGHFIVSLNFEIRPRYTRTHTNTKRIFPKSKRSRLINVRVLPCIGSLMNPVVCTTHVRFVTSLPIAYWLEYPTGVRMIGLHSLSGQLFLLSPQNGGYLP